MARIKQLAKRYKMNPRKSKRLQENEKTREEEETEKSEMPKKK